MTTDRRLVALLQPYTGWFALGIGAAAVASVLDGATIVVLVPFLKHLFGTAGALGAPGTPLERITDQLLGPVLVGTSSGVAALRIMALLGGALMLKNLLVYAASQTSTRIQEGVVRDLRVRLFDHLLGVDLGFFQATRAGQLIAALIAEAEQVKIAVTSTYAALFTNATVMLVTLTILATISWRLTLLTLATAPLLLLGVRVLILRLRRHADERVRARGDLTGIAAERLGAMKLIRAAGTEAEESARFAEQAASYRKRVIRTERFAQLTSPVTEVFAGMVLILIIWAATVPALTGTPLGPEVTLVFLLGALKTMAPLKSLTQFPAHWATAVASARRVFELLDHPATASRETGTGEARFTGALEYDRVSFRYPGGDQLLDQVSFRVAKGEVVALVGPSGGGKTTLVELLPRFWEPTGGEIRLDGAPIASLTRRSLRALLAVVGQDTVLFNDTVHRNIAYGRPTATREQVARAAAAANAAEFIDRLPEGYDTVVGERGARLSGGQRQRLAIARALLRDAPILILDEATSALDTASERLVQQAIDRLMVDRTVLVIAHRLATVRHADRILVLDHGRVVEQGTHHQLHARGGLYRRLHDLQFQDDPVAVS